jgi:hypothetical protein
MIAFVPQNGKNAFENKERNPSALIALKNNNFSQKICG